MGRAGPENLTAKVKTVPIRVTGLASFPFAIFRIGMF
jgi:hypothetical protein